MSASNPHIVILGGGLCGLYAARILTRKGFQVTVIEKGERPGGLATACRYGDNWYDTGQHMFHSFDREIFEDIKQIMGDERIEVPLNAKIKWGGNHFRYPLQFQDMIKGIPIFQLTQQVIGLVFAQLKNYISPWQPKDAEEALLQLYGKPLYKFFFEDFTHRYWEIHPRELSATFITTKMPKLTAVDVVKKLLAKVGIKEHAKATESPLTEEILHYSKNGSEAMPRCLARAVTEKNGRIILNAEVKSVISKNNQINKIVYQTDGETHELDCDACISTIPLKSFIAAMQPPSPPEVLFAAKQLRYKPIAIYGLLVKKQKCFDALFIYYRDHLFHRVCEPKNAGLEVNPADHTILVVEMTCEVGDPKWLGDDSVKQRLYKELAAENICQPHEIVEVHITRNETGYPIFSLGFEPNLEKIQTYMDGFNNLHSAGRQGGFTYPNMHKAMRMGWQSADKIIEVLDKQDKTTIEQESEAAVFA